MSLEDFAAQVASIAALGEPTRRALYRHVVAQSEPVSRDQAANAIGVAPHIAKFHLDRLEECGLLEVEYSRPAGRTGPGAGRPTKFYRRSKRDVTVSLPERHYDLAGRILATAIRTAQDGEVTVAEALRGAGTTVGRSLGEEARGRGGPQRDQAELLVALRQAVDDYGYESRAEGDGLTLGNCPFRALSEDYRDVICAMNFHLVSGLIEGLQATTIEAQFDPAPGRCCVTVSAP